MMKIAIFAFLLIAQGFSKSVELEEEEEEFSGLSGEAGTEDADERILMPGTKWCGSGNRAENDDDLGTYVELDKCCRAHDKCPRTVEGFSSNYGYRNWWPVTVSDCECDKKFYKCMKRVKNHKTATRMVGKLFFNILTMPCLKFNAGGTKAKKGSSPWY